MDDADLAGPLLFVFCFGTFLLFVRIATLLVACDRELMTATSTVRQASVRIYLWSRRARLALYLYPPQSHVRKGHRRVPRRLRPRILSTTHGSRRRSQCGGDVRVSVPVISNLPACLCTRISGMLGYVLSTLSILWCTYAASGIFVAVLRMSDQRLLLAYPIGLLYGCFALLSVFNVGVGGGSAK